MFKRTNRFIMKMSERHPWAVVLSAVAVGGAAGAVSRWVLSPGDREARRGSTAASFAASALMFVVRTAAGRALAQALESSLGGRDDRVETVSEPTPIYNQQPKEHLNVEQPNHN